MTSKSCSKRVNRKERKAAIQKMIISQKENIPNFDVVRIQNPIRKTNREREKIFFGGKDCQH